MSDTQQNKNNKKQPGSTLKHKAETVNKVTLYNNCIVYHGQKTLYYLVNLYNYNLYTEQSTGTQLDALTNLILNIENSLSELKFSIFRFQDVVSGDEYINLFLKTVRMWQPDFQLTPEFESNVTSLSKDYCFLAINIDEKKNIDFNQTSIKDIINEYKNNFIDIFAATEQQQIDTKKIDDLNTTILNMGRNLIRPCPEEILFSYYLSRVFPSYDLVFDSNSYQQNKAVISWLKQDFIDHFNYFEMTNSGVELFQAPQQITYGSVIDIIEFPDEIPSEQWPLIHNGMVINNKTLTKNQAKLKFKRKRADLEYEEDTAAQADSQDVFYDLADCKDIVELGIAAVSMGKKIVESDIHILVLANDLDELNRQRAALISELKDRNVTATFAPNQATSYIDSFIKLRPKVYPFTFDLRYPLSFRLNQGNAICDVDSEFTTPVFGHYVDAVEATD